jgi:hypothetical protein
VHVLARDLRRRFSQRVMMKRAGRHDVAAVLLVPRAKVLCSTALLQSFDLINAIDALYRSHSAATAPRLTALIRALPRLRFAGNEIQSLERPSALNQRSAARTA